MLSSTDNIKIPYPTEGVIRSAQLNDTVTPENSAQLALNINFDRVGAWQTRPGVQTLYGSRSGSITSFGALNIQGGVKKLFSQVATDISVWTGSAWSSVRTCTTSNKARFSQWLNRLYMVNGVDALQCSSGSTFSAEAGFVPATTMPLGHFIQAGFDGRIWIGNKDTDALYFSDIVQFSPPSTYTLTYTATNFIQTLSSQDGESMTGLFRVPRALLVFKQNHIYRVYNSANIDPYPAYNVGTYSQESIVQAKDGLYFHHSSGFYKFNYDGQPTEISKRVVDVVKAIPRANYENVVGIYDGYDAVKWSIGPCTIEGTAYTNLQMRYTISTQVWTIYDFPGNTVTALIPFDDGSNIYQTVGTAAGRVGQLDSGTDDFGEPIPYDFIDRWRSFLEMYSKAKEISGVAVMSLNGGGAQLQYQTDKSGPNVWEDIETLTEDFASLFPNGKTETDFNILRFRLKGQTKGTPIVFTGIEILTLMDKGFDKN